MDHAPKNQAEYLKRFHENNRMEGFGFETTCVAPCPFCAAPDWQSWKIIDVESKMREEAKCKECGRSAKAIFTRTPGGVSFEFVQTGGDDQPEWLFPKMRRVP